MKKLVSMFLDSGWKSIVAAFFCFAVSAVGFVITSIECGRHGEGSVERCVQYGSRNPYVILSLLLVIIFGIAALQSSGHGARRILLWWAVLVLVAVGWLMFA